MVSSPSLERHGLQKLSNVIRRRKLSPAGALALASQSLQSITEETISQREERSLLMVELVVPAIQLAQQVAEQLHAYGLDVDEKGRSRLLEGRLANYAVEPVTWTVGPRFRRQTRTATILISYGNTGWPSLLWNPQTADVNWDLDNPPRLALQGSSAHYGRSLNSVPLAGVAVFTAWAEDATALLDEIRKSAQESTERVRRGVKESISALEALNL